MANSSERPIWNIQLVVGQNVVDRLNRENILIVRNPSLAAILIISN